MLRPWPMILPNLLRCRLRPADRPPRTPGHFFLLDRDNPDSLRSNVANARSRAREVRQSISREVWEEVNRLHLHLAATPAVEGSQLGRLCSEVKRSVAATVGMR